MESADRFRLDGRVAFVSGGGGAIGSAIAVALGAAGAKVAVADIDQGHADVKVAIRIFALPLR
jgi:NAD(P)-dependent dehydrogenase (short-subunit alcohol dehydrogenase family)